MPDGHNNDYLDDLLNLLANRVHRRRQQSRVPGPGGFRTIDEISDETGIDDNNATDNLIADDTYILDCGHPARGNLGGRCHFCDGLVCKNCILICSSCGHSICNLHCVITIFDGQNKPYCRDCTDEIRRGLKLRALGNTILSFFFSQNKTSDHGGYYE